MNELLEEVKMSAEIAAADEALKALQADTGDPEIKEAPNKLHSEEIELHGGATSAETAIDKDDQFAGGSPSLPQQEPEPYLPIEPMGALPNNADAADLAEFGRTFTCGRDKRAFRRAMRLSARR
jgi:hypothetical protein